MPNCLQNNAISLDLICEKEDFESLIKADAPTQKELWKASPHCEEETQELKNQLEQQVLDEQARDQRLKLLQEQQARAAAAPVKIDIDPFSPVKEKKERKKRETKDKSNKAMFKLETKDQIKAQKLIVKLNL